MHQESDREIRVSLVQATDLDFYWETVSEGLEVASKNSEDELSLEDVYNAVAGGKFHMWIVVVGNEYGGVLITQPLITRSSRWMDIIFCYTVPEQNRESDNKSLVVEGLKKVEKFARSLGCTGVKFLSKRDGFSRLSKKAGYERRFVEYVKRFE